MSRSWIYAIVLLVLAVPMAFCCAHVFEVNGSVGAQLHIDPADDPVAGSPAKLFFDFRDSDAKFKTEDCMCTVSITSSVANSFLADISETSPEGIIRGSNNISFPYTFPKEGIYLVKIAGTPKAESGFKPFELSYNVRVEKEGAVASSTHNHGGIFGEHTVHYLLFGPAILLALGIVFYDRFKKKGYTSDIKK